MTEETTLLEKQNLEQARFIFIVGATGTGKTALAFKILEKLNKEAYVLRHPKPELLKPLGYTNLRSVEDIARLRDCAVYIDEPQLILNEKSYKTIPLLLKLISLSRHRNINLILSTSDTRSITSALEAYIDLWLIKNVDYSTTKQRGIIREALRENSFISPSEIELKNNEFISHSFKLKAFNGFHSFNLADGWTDSLSISYR